VAHEFLKIKYGPADGTQVSAFAAGIRKISMPDVRAAARAWFQTDKEAALRGRAEVQRLLNWIIDKVIKQKRARGFLVNQKSAEAQNVPDVSPILFAASHKLASRRCP
jgi:hypothetical protein